MRWEFERSLSFFAVDIVRREGRQADGHILAGTRKYPFHATSCRENKSLPFLNDSSPLAVFNMCFALQEHDMLFEFRALPRVCCWLCDFDMGCRDSGFLAADTAKILGDCQAW